MGLLGKIAGSALGAAGGLLQSRGSRKAAKRASKAQQQAAQQAANAQTQSYDEIKQGQSPYIDAGLTSQNRLLSLLGLGGDPKSQDYGKYGRDFGMQDFQQDPGYSFRLSEGLKALDRQAAARGGLISGAALKAAQNYGQQAASQEYTNAFNRYQTNRGNQLDPLYRLMGAGQSASNYLGQANMNKAANLSNIYQNKGDAKAAGFIGQQDAKNAGIQGVTDAITNFLPF